MILKSGSSLCFFLSLIFLITFPIPGVFGEDQWINPKALIGDPSLARLQQGRKELGPGEKEDLARYGYTGLELMTYVDANKESAKDEEAFYRLMEISSNGSIRSDVSLRRKKYYRASYKDNLTYNSKYKPGKIWAKRRGIYTDPPDKRGWNWIAYMFLRSENFRRLEEGWMWQPATRKVLRYTVNPQEDPMAGTEMTMDDFRWREPWEEDHKIIGEDIIQGKKCFVIESRHCLKTSYYLCKRVTWIERQNFLDLHEEQYDCNGQIWKVIDNQWEQIEPWNYWVRKERYFYDLKSKNRTLLQAYDWIFNQGTDDTFFNPMGLYDNRIWREPREPIPPIKSLADIPPPPSVRTQFLATNVN
jgi:hypothetical protein